MHTWAIGFQSFPLNSTSQFLFTSSAASTFPERNSAPRAASPERITISHADVKISAIHSSIATRRTIFAEAAAQWLHDRRPFLKARTWTGYSLHVKQLNQVFGEMALKDIHIGHIRDYQQKRLSNHQNLWPKTATAEYVNHQIVVLQGILERADEWAKIARHYEALPKVSTRPPKVMSDEEEMLLFDIASRNPDWQLAYWIASITLNTGASGTELRHLRFSDIHLSDRIPWFRIDAETAKNEHRGRVVPLNPTALINIERCLTRAQELGSGLGNHFVFPFREAPGRWDPTKPATDGWMRRSFSAMSIAAGIPWLTPHCLRHQHITLSMEAGEPIEQIRLRVGHVSSKMTQWYMSPRSETQFAAVNSIDPSARYTSRHSERTTRRPTQNVISMRARLS